MRRARRHRRSCSVRSSVSLGGGVGAPSDPPEPYVPVMVVSQVVQGDVGVPEQQRFSSSVIAWGGTFDVYDPDGDATVSGIAYNVTRSAMATALQGLGGAWAAAQAWSGVSTGGFTVKNNIQNGYVFRATGSDGDLSMLEVDDSSMKLAGVMPIMNGTNRTFVLEGATGGTFSLTPDVGGSAINGLAWDISAAGLQAAIAASDWYLKESFVVEETSDPNRYTFTVPVDYDGFGFVVGTGSLT